MTRNAGRVPHVDDGTARKGTQWPTTPHLTVFVASCIGCAQRTRATPKSGSAAWRRRRGTVRSAPGEVHPPHQTPGRNVRGRNGRFGDGPPEARDLDLWEDRQRGGASCPRG